MERLKRMKNQRAHNFFFNIIVKCLFAHLLHIFDVVAAVAIQITKRPIQAVFTRSLHLQ